MTSKPALAVAAALVALVSVITAGAQEEPEMSEEAIAQMNAWMGIASPGEHHEHLVRYVGRWESEVKMWMEPGGEPMISPAMVTAQMVLGGRYLEWDFEGVFGGMPFEAKQLDGYNNGEQRFESTWADNFGTLIISYAGQCDDDCSTRTMHGEFFDPMSGGKIAQRAVYTWIDDDNWLYESYMTQSDSEFKNMEIRYTRVN